MSRMPNILNHWPDLFHGLTDDQIELIIQISANSYLETGRVDRFSTELLCQAVRGDISFDEAQVIALNQIISKI